MFYRFGVLAHYCIGVEPTQRRCGGTLLRYHAFEGNSFSGLPLFRFSVRPPKRKSIFTFYRLPAFRDDHNLLDIAADASM
jgi:hypothetical protein